MRHPAGGGRDDSDRAASRRRFSRRSVSLRAAAAVRLMPSVNRILSSITAIRHFYPALAGRRRRVPGRWTSRPLASRTSGAPQADFTWQSVRFDDVSYRYPGATKDAVSKVSCSRSGAGSRSPWWAARALARRRSPTSCSVCSLRRRGRSQLDGASSGGNPPGIGLVMGYVPQPSYLLDESVRRNVAFGTVEEAEIDDAACLRGVSIGSQMRGGRRRDGRATRLARGP